MATPTPTPMAGEGTLAAVMPRSPSSPAAAAAEAPMLIFLYFHKAIRAELEGLHGAAVRLATERAGDVEALAERCRFFFNIYKHHCDAEDAVIFPALDIRVKNIAGTYSLEHKGESDMFTQLFALLLLDIQNDDGLRRELASCTGAIQTCLTQHMSKEEEQEILASPRHLRRHSSHSYVCIGMLCTRTNMRFSATHFPMKDVR